MKLWLIRIEMLYIYMIFVYKNIFIFYEHEVIQFFPYLLEQMVTSLVIISSSKTHQIYIYIFLSWRVYLEWENSNLLLLGWWYMPITVKLCWVWQTHQTFIFHLRNKFKSFLQWRTTLLDYSFLYWWNVGSTCNEMTWN